MALSAAERGFLREKMNRHERRMMRSSWARVAGDRRRARGLEDSTKSSADDFAQYRDDPVGFIRDVLGIELWSRQAEIARAVASGGQVAAKTGHKIGKSLLAAGLALWWVCTRPAGAVIVTAPAAHQVKNIVWKELRRLHSKIRDRVGGDMPKDPSIGLELSSGAKIIGIATDTPERAAGLSGPEVFVIIDEASGYPDDIYQAIETSTAGGEDSHDDDAEGVSRGEAKILAIGNPTRTSGWFFDIFRTGNPDWSRHTVSSEETPNATKDSGERPIRGIATRDFIEKLRRKYGPNPDTHPVYMVRVKGLYPERSSNSVVALADVDAATSEARARKTRIPAPPHEATLGVDVARFGDDDSAIASTIGDVMLGIEEFSGMDGPSLAAEVLRIARRFAIEGRRVRINVDGVGVGASVLDALVRSDLVREGIAYVVDIQAGAKADDEANYVNLRSQLWFDFGVWLAEGGVLPQHGDLSRQVLAPTYSLDKAGRIAVESKDETKKKLDGKSPDLADAAIMSVYRGRRPEYRYSPATKAADSEDGRVSRLPSRGLRGRSGRM